MIENLSMYVSYNTVNINNMIIRIIDFAINLTKSQILLKNKIQFSRISDWICYEIKLRADDVYSFHDLLKSRYQDDDEESSCNNEPFDSDQRPLLTTILQH